MFDIFVLSLRQLTGKWRLLFSLLLGAFPIVMAALQSASGDVITQEEIDSVLVSGLLISAILPLVVLSVATASFSNEVEDRTLSNLTLTPVPRWKIVLPKLAAAIVAGAPMPVISGVISMVVLLQGSDLGGVGQSVAAVGIGLFIGACVYAALFLWTGLLTTRAIGIALLYVFLWEGLFASFVSGIRYLSVRHYMLGIMHGLDEHRFSESTTLLSFPVAVVAAIAVFAIFAALSVRRLRAMDVP